MTVDCVIQTLNKAKLQYHIPEGMILHTKSEWLRKYGKCIIKMWCNKYR